MSLREHLSALNACPEARSWVGGRSPAEALAACKRPDWLLWYLAQSIKAPSDRWHRLVVSLAADCAETALQFIPTGEERPRLALEAARRWAAEPNAESLAACRIAADAAAYAVAAYATAYDAAAAAARAAATAYDAYAAAAAAYAVNAAANAADAADDAAAYTGEAQTCVQLCDLIRRRLAEQPELLAEILAEASSQ